MSKQKAMYGKAQLGMKRVETETENYPTDHPLEADLMRLHAQATIAVAESIIGLRETQETMIVALNEITVALHRLNNDDAIKAIHEETIRTNKSIALSLVHEIAALGDRLVSVMRRTDAE